MEKKKVNNQDQKPVPKEIGSNLTGTALAGKPGHERDIDPKTFNKETLKEKSESEGHIENTDALLGDVHPTRRNKKSLEQHNADQES